MRVFLYTFSVFNAFIDNQHVLSLVLRRLVSFSHSGGFPIEASGQTDPQGQIHIDEGDLLICCLRLNVTCRHSLST